MYLDAPNCPEFAICLAQQRHRGLLLGDIVTIYATTKGNHIRVHALREAAAERHTSAVLNYFSSLRALHEFMQSCVLRQS